MTDKREELRGKVLILKDLITYQEGSVASKMIIFNKGGNITLFSFDEHEGLPEHTAPFDAVVTILEGECEVIVHGKAFPMREGETIIFPAHAPHAVTGVTQFKMTITMIHNEIES